MQGLNTISAGAMTILRMVHLRDQCSRAKSRWMSCTRRCPQGCPARPLSWPILIASASGTRIGDAAHGAWPEELDKHKRSKSSPAARLLFARKAAAEAEPDHQPSHQSPVSEAAHNTSVGTGFKQPSGPAATEGESHVSHILQLAEQWCCYVGMGKPRPANPSIVSR